jgi:hypothetical protein
MMPVKISAIAGCAATGDPATPEELRSKSLAARAHEADQQVDHPGQPGVDGHDVRASPREFTGDDELQSIWIHPDSLRQAGAVL